MTDLSAFGVEPKDPPAADHPDDDTKEPESVWPECDDCGHTGYDVRVRSPHSVPLCPDCFADREGLR